MLVTFKLSHHGHILHGLLEMLNLLPNIFVSIGKIQSHPLMNLWSSIQWFSIPDVHLRICINLKLVIPIVQFDWLVTVLESCFIFLQPLICCCSVLVDNSQLYLPRNSELEKYWYVGCGIVIPEKESTENHYTCGVDRHWLPLCKAQSPFQIHFSWTIHSLLLWYPEPCPETSPPCLHSTQLKFSPWMMAALQSVCCCPALYILHTLYKL